jgi:sarcosine oxidase delta subunit
VDEKAFYRESQVSKPMTLNCPYCRTTDTYELRWLVRRKVDRLPRQADERDRAKFAKAASYMVLLDDKAGCKNARCRRTFEVSGVKTTAFLTD